LRQSAHTRVWDCTANHPPGVVPGAKCQCRVRLQVVTGLGGGLNIFFAALLIAFRRAWSMLFTADAAIVARLDPVIVWLSIALVGEQLHAPSMQQRCWSVEVISYSVLIGAVMLPPPAQPFCCRRSGGDDGSGNERLLRFCNLFKGPNKVPVRLINRGRRLHRALRRAPRRRAATARRRHHGGRVVGHRPPAAGGARVLCRLGRRRHVARRSGVVHHPGNSRGACAHRPHADYPGRCESPNCDVSL
jgi:hypothetical protein